jgi:hypothetical protein
MIILKITAEDNQNRKKKKKNSDQAGKAVQKKIIQETDFHFHVENHFFIMASTFLCRNMVC